MRCHKAREYISQQMDEHLPPDATVDLTEHLDSCDDCREYREDLLFGRRAMGATVPELPDNFDWKLQLKLNQTLQHTAGEAAYPWAETNQDRGSWLSNFGASAAVGMAAVLALAMFIGPTQTPREAGPEASGGVSSGVVHSPTGGAGSSDRLPLFVNQSRRGGGLYGSGVQRTVSAGDSYRTSSGGLIDHGWSGHDIEDLRTIQRLRNQNKQMNRVLFQQQQIIRGMRAQLDTIDTNALDLEQE